MDGARSGETFFPLIVGTRAYNATTKDSPNPGRLATFGQKQAAPDFMGDDFFEELSNR
jgi:hypothetical protein